MRGNAQDLSHYQVFVVDEPNRAFSAAEKTAILNYVQAGGSLFMVADHTGSDRDGDGKDSVIIWNELFSNNTVQTAPFGIVFNSNNISPSNESADSSPSNPITHGVAGTITQFVYADGCSLTINPANNASTRGAVWTTSSHTNSNVMVAYGTFGAGKFVAIGDSSPVDDGTGASGNTLFDGWNDGGGDDGQLIINASLWLATAASAPPPANDNFASAFTLTGSSTSATGTNVNATKETGEPNHGGNVGRQIRLVEMDGSVIGRHRHRYQRQQFRYAPRRLYRHRRQRAHADRRRQQWRTEPNESRNFRRHRWSHLPHRR